MIKEYKVTEEKLLEITADKGKREVYDLTRPLSEKALIVLNEKQDILHQMDLKSVIANLDNAVDLLDVSYHAVYGFSVQSQVFSLQKRVMDLNDKGIVVITDFKNQSGVVVTELISVFKWLVKGAETVAIGKLEKFADMASGMSEQAEEMAEDYEAAADRTSSVLQEVIKENTAQYEKNDKLKTMMAEIQAESESSKEIEESIKKRLETLKTEYGRLSAAEEREEKHQFTMQIIGTVFSFLGKAVDIVGSSEATVADTPQDDSKLQEAKERKEKLDSQIEEKNTAIADLEKQLQEKIAEKDSADEAGKEALEKEIKELREKIRKEKENLKELTKEQKSASEVVKKLGGLLSETGEKLQEQSEDKAVLRSKRMQEIYQEIIRLEEEQTKQLGLLAKYTKQIQGMVIDQNATEAAIQSLIIAVSCLKRTVVALKDIALFWTSLEQSCRALSKSSLKDTIKDLQSIDKEERIAYYYSEDIMYPLLCYMAKWTAILSVSSDYIKAAEETRKHLNDTIIHADSTEMSRTEHWDKASALAGQVSERIEAQVAESREKIKNLESRQETAKGENT